MHKPVPGLPEPLSPARLVAERKRLGLSKAEMARRLGVSNPSQVAYEAGAHKPSGVYVAALLSVGVDVPRYLWGIPARRFGADVMDWDAFAQILEEIDTQVDDLRREMSTRERVSTAVSIYRQMFPQYECSGAEANPFLALAVSKSLAA